MWPVSAHYRLGEAEEVWQSEANVGVRMVRKALEASFIQI